MLKSLVGSLLSRQLLQQQQQILIPAVIAVRHLVSRQLLQQQQQQQFLIPAVTAVRHLGQRPLRPLPAVSILVLRLKFLSVVISLFCKI